MDGTKQRSRKRRWTWKSLALGALYLAGTGCDDSVLMDWSEVPDTTLLYSMARPELNLPSAFDVVYGIGLPVESLGAVGQFDFVVDTEDGHLTLNPPGVFGIESEARIAPIPAMDFWDLTKAPSDTTLFRREEPVTVEEGTIFVIQSREVVDSYYGYTCVYYAKLEALEIDAVGGILQFRYLVNPNCNNTSLVPP